jgi:hypothetical protein
MDVHIPTLVLHIKTGYLSEWQTNDDKYHLESKIINRTVI